MPRFYTHILNDTTFTADEEGREYPDLAAASLVARRSLAEIIAEELVEGKDEVNLTAMIDDADRVRVGNLRAATRLVTSVSPFAE